MRMIRRAVHDDGVRVAVPPAEEATALARAFTISLAWTREQLAIWFPQDSVVTLCRRLQRNTDRGVLTRIRLPATRGSGQYVYFLSPWGSRVLLGPAVTPPRGAPGRDIYHSLGITNFYLALTAALRAIDGEMIQWWGQAGAACPLGAAGGTYVNPDAAFLIGHRWEQLCLLEYDRAPNSAGATQWLNKISRYLRYYSDRLYRVQFGGTPLRPILLCLFADEDRGQRLLERTRQVLAHSRTPRPTILFGASTAANQPLGQVWRALDSESQCSLLDDALQ